MNLGSRIPSILIALLLGVFYLASPTCAKTPIAKISGFKGEVIIQSKANIFDLTKIGRPLMEGDRIQTRQGEAKITFNDGAVMKVRPWSSAMISEREEETGWWIFKTRKAVRKITCFVGKLWFKSGASKRKNYLQTPTAVCGLRGSEASVGFDNIVSYLAVATGIPESVVGKFVEGDFDIPGEGPARNNQAWKDLKNAKDQIDVAKTDEEKKAAAINAIQKLIDALESLSDEVKNADPNIQKLIDAANELKGNLESGEVTMKRIMDATPTIPAVLTTTTTTIPVTTTTVPATTTTPTTTTESTVSGE